MPCSMRAIAEPASAKVNRSICVISLWGSKELVVWYLFSRSDHIPYAEGKSRIWGLMKSVTDCIKILLARASARDRTWGDHCPVVFPSGVSVSRIPNT